MAAELFNTLGGYSVGIPPIPVIDSTGNVSANSIKTNHLLYSNGAPYIVPSQAAGNTTEVLFNLSNVVAASPSFTFDSTTNLLSTVDITISGNTNLGSVSNIHISGGISGDVLQTDGAGNLTWATGGGGGNGSPGGANTQIQFNSSGTFGGSSYLTYNNATKILNVAGGLIANSFQMGSGIYKFCSTSVYSAVTSSTSANQVLWSVPVSQVTAVDFMIVSTDVVGNTRQTSKLSATVLGDVVIYNEYAGLNINGGVGTFYVEYYAGDIIIPPSLQLTITPDSIATTKYDMLITEYASL